MPRKKLIAKMQHEGASGPPDRRALHVPGERCCRCRKGFSKKEKRAMDSNDSDDSSVAEAHHKENGPAMCRECNRKNAHLKCLREKDREIWKETGEWTCLRCKFKQDADLLMCQFFEPGPASQSAT